MVVVKTEAKCAPYVFHGGGPRSHGVSPGSDHQDGLTTHGSLSMGGGIPRLVEGLFHVLLDIDLPAGYRGRLSTYGAPISFVERVGWGFYGNGVIATAATVEHPRVTVGFRCTSIIARLID